MGIKTANNVKYWKIRAPHCQECNKPITIRQVMNRRVFWDSGVKGNKTSRRAHINCAVEKGE